MVECWNCGAKKEGKISFKEQCDLCDADLHVCAGCKFYQVGLSNDCRIPDTEKIVDRYRNQYCEDFSPITIRKSSQQPAGIDKKKKFEDLFR